MFALERLLILGGVFLGGSEKSGESLSDCFPITDLQFTNSDEVPPLRVLKKPQEIMEEAESEEDRPEEAETTKKRKKKSKHIEKLMVKEFKE